MPVAMVDLDLVVTAAMAATVRCRGAMAAMAPPLLTPTVHPQLQLLVAAELAALPLHEALPSWVAPAAAALVAMAAQVALPRAALAATSPSRAMERNWLALM